MSRSSKSSSSNPSKPKRASKTVNAKSTAKTPLFYLATPAVKGSAPCYIPLCLSSQSGHSHVLYYNANAPVDELFDCATARLQAVIDLMEGLLEYNNAEKKSLPAVASVSAYLLNDAMTLLQELNPIATALKARVSSGS